MRLSEAIRLGAMWGPQTSGVSYDPTTHGTCAMGAAWLASGRQPLATTWPWR